MQFYEKGTTEQLFDQKSWLSPHFQTNVIQKIYNYLKSSNKNKKNSVDNISKSSDNKRLMFNQKKI